MTGRFILVDTLGFPNLMQTLKDGKRIEHRNYVFLAFKSGEEDVFELWRLQKVLMVDGTNMTWEAWHGQEAWAGRLCCSNEPVVSWWCVVWLE